MLQRNKRKLPRYVVAASFIAFLSLGAASLAPSAEARLDGGSHHESTRGEKDGFGFWANIVKVFRTLIRHHVSGGNPGSGNTCS